MIVNDNMEQKYGIKEMVLEQLIGLAKKYHLKQLILFGSRARGDYHRTSDIDFSIRGGNFARFSIEQEGIVLYEEI